MLSQTAFAQTAGQIAPPDFRPPAQAAAGGVDIPEGTGLDAPEGAEALTVLISGVDVEGGFPDMAAATAAVVNRIAGRTVTASEIFAAARALETAYARAGYGLARVVLPPQSLDDGARLRLVVVDGFIERVDVSAVPERIRARVAATVAPLVGQRRVRLDLIERKLLLAGDTPGTVMRTTLAAGEQPGGSVLIVEARHQPVTGQATVDNQLSSALGEVNAGVGVDLNGVAGLGELVYLRMAGYPNDGRNGYFSDDPRNRSLAGGIVVPLGLDGVSFNLEGAVTEANPLPTAEGIGFGSAYSRFSARLRYAAIRSRDLNLNAEIALDATEERVEVREPSFAPVSLDRLRIARLTVDGSWYTPQGGLLTGRVTGSLGIDGLGARSAGDADPMLPLSRQGSDAAFEKLEVALGYGQLLAEHVGIDLSARAQTSFGQPLASSEQIGIASATGLSSFDSGSLSGDSGYVLRGELSSPFDVAVEGGALGLSPYVFGAYGQIRLEQPTALEEETVGGASYGVGVRIGASRNASLRNAGLVLEWGRQHRDDGVPRSDRLSVFGSLQF